MEKKLECGDCGQYIISNEWLSVDSIPHLISCPQHRERLSEMAPKGEAIV